MKKHFLWLALGISALTSCTSTEVYEEGPQSNAIGFTNVVKKSNVSSDLSRASATLMNNESFKKFWVFGYYTKNTNGPATPVFNSVEVTNNSGNWGYSNTRYWIPEASYNFYALSCAGVEFAPAFGMATMDLSNALFQDRSLVIKNYKCNTNHQHDLLFARNENFQSKKDGETNDDVSLSFQHILSRLNFTFVSNFPEGYNVAISEIKLDWIYDEATFNDDNNNGWSNLNKTEANHVDIDMTSETVTKGSSKSSSDIFVIPYNYKNTKEENVQISFVINVFSGEEHVYTHQIKAQWAPMWVMGNYYKYTITLEGGNIGLGEIKFSADIQSGETGEWSNGDVSPIIVAG